MPFSTIELLVVLLVIAITCIIMLVFQVNRLAERRYRSWQARDLDLSKKEQLDIARRESIAQLQEWKIENEVSIRQDAIMRSQAVIRGRITEHLAPYMAIFPYNPKDIRFVGSPIDFIVFDGVDDGGVNEIIFLEVKSGNSTLNPRQRKIRDAVIEGRVKWRELRIPAGNFD